jgi:hypothetical protein
VQALLAVPALSNTAFPELLELEDERAALSQVMPDEALVDTPQAERK